MAWAVHSGSSSAAVTLTRRHPVARAAPGLRVSDAATHFDENAGRPTISASNGALDPTPNAASGRQGNHSAPCSCQRNAAPSGHRTPTCCRRRLVAVDGAAVADVNGGKEFEAGGATHAGPPVLGGTNGTAGRRGPTGGASGSGALTTRSPSSPGGAGRHPPTSPGGTGSRSAVRSPPRQQTTCRSRRSSPTGSGRPSNPNPGASPR